MKKLVMIEWVDSYGCSTSWSEIPDLKNTKPVTARSVGWLLYNGSDCKVIVPHMSSTSPRLRAQGCGDMTIPTQAIVRIQELKVTKPKAPA